MTFSGCGSYHKDTFDHDEFIATVHSIYQINLRA